jgi:mono/diheme cytochrome c family protein
MTLMEADKQPHDSDEATANPGGGHGDHSSAATGGGDSELHGLLAEFDTPGALIAAARKVKNAGYTEFDCYSPFPVHGIDDAMGIKRTRLPLAVFAGGAIGLGLGVLMQWWMNAHNWPWNVGGKPTWSIPANVPIAYETTILLSVLTTFIGMWAANKLPQVWHPFFSVERFATVTDDGMFLGIEASDQRFELEQTKQLLVAAGATHVEECHVDTRPEARNVPRWIYGAMTVLTVVAIIPFALAFKARASKSSDPHWHVFSDMDFQPKAKSDQPFAEFADGRANRGEVSGSVARGSLNADDAYYRGLRDGQWITDLPASLVVDGKLLDRGQERFNIYCSPCHGYNGAGHGIVAERVAAAGGAWEARNLVASDSAVIKMPNGQLFNTISNGYNTMMGYAAQIPVRDRWAILLYVRALERGQNATQAELPAGAQVR